MQRRIAAPGKPTSRVDFLYEPTVVIEVTGHGGHSTQRQRRADAQRRNRLQSLGFDVIEFTYEMVRSDPGLRPLHRRRARRLHGAGPGPRRADRQVLLSARIDITRGSAHAKRLARGFECGKRPGRSIRALRTGLVLAAAAEAAALATEGTSPMVRTTPGPSSRGPSGSSSVIALRSSARNVSSSWPSGISRSWVRSMSWSPEAADASPCWSDWSDATAGGDCIVCTDPPGGGPNPLGTVCGASGWGALGGGAKVRSSFGADCTTSTGRDRRGTHRLGLGLRLDLRLGDRLGNRCRCRLGGGLGGGTPDRLLDALGALDPEGVGVVDDPLQLLDRGAQPLALEVDVLLERAEVGEQGVALVLELADLAGQREPGLGRVAVGLLAAVGQDGGASRRAAATSESASSRASRTAASAVRWASTRVRCISSTTAFSGSLGAPSPLGVRLGDLRTAVGLDELTLEPRHRGATRSRKSSTSSGSYPRRTCWKSCPR